MPQFDTSLFISQLFWLSVAFAILYLIVIRLIIPRAKSVIEDRAAYIAKNLAETEQLNQNIAELETTKVDLIHSTNQQITAINQQAAQDVEAIILKRQQDLKQKIQQLTNAFDQEILNHRENFKQNSQTAHLQAAQLIVEKLTNKPADFALLTKLYQQKN